MNYYNEIKEQLINNEVYKRVKDYSENRSDLETYYNVGKLLVEAQGGKERAKYGDGLIKEYSKRLTLELNKKFTYTLLKNIRQFYLLLQKGPTLSDQLTWSHYVELLYLKDVDKISYYIKISIEQNLSIRELRERIKSQDYERLDDNTKQKLITQSETKITDLIKNPILIKNSYDYQEVTERDIKTIDTRRYRTFYERIR